MDLKTHEVVGIGDAENDHIFIESCGYGVAVSNAIPALKDHVDWITEGPRGEGVVEIIDRMIADDLASLPAPRREAIPERRAHQEGWRP